MTIQTARELTVSMMLHMEWQLTVLFCFCHVSGMLALALDDFTLLVADIETRRVVRKFAGHQGNVNDMVGPGTRLTNC